MFREKSLPVYNVRVIFTGYVALGTSDPLAPDGNFKKAPKGNVNLPNGNVMPCRKFAKSKSRQVPMTLK